VFLGGPYSEQVQDVERTLHLALGDADRLGELVDAIVDVAAPLWVVAVGELAADFRDGLGVYAAVE